jgi:hypothetical protein
VFLQVLDLVVHLNHARPMSTAAPAAAQSKVPVGARKVRENILIYFRHFLHSEVYCVSVLIVVMFVTYMSRLV